MQDNDREKKTGDNEMLRAVEDWEQTFLILSL
jgi:hypothetical protein